MQNEPIKNEDSIADYLDGLKKDESPSVVTEEYERYQETQKEIMEIEIKKTRNMLWILAAVFLGINVIALLQLGVSISDFWLEIMIIPAVLAGLGFMAIKEPLVATIIATVIIGGLWIYNVVLLGSIAIVSGWLWKGIIIYLIIACFQHARLANKIKRELKL